MTAPPLNVAGWTIRKQFYADGPSLFVWTVERDDEYAEFKRRRDAVAYAQAHPYHQEAS